MPTRNPASAYQDQAVSTADGPRLLLMICDRLSADMARAEVALELRNYATVNDNLQHAQRLFRMLLNALDPDGFEGGHELMSVYVFIERHLIKANLEKSVHVLRECIDLFQPIHEAWVAAVNAKERSGDGSFLA